MNDFVLPHTLDKAELDGDCPVTGMILKSLKTDRRALVVEIADNGKDLIVVMPLEPIVVAGKLPGPERYEVRKIKRKRFCDWLVLQRPLSEWEALIP